MTNSDQKNDQQSNSGFIFGLVVGAAAGALSSILIHKSDEKEVIQNFESKIKDFFQDLITDVKNKKETPSKKIEFIDIKEEKEESEKAPIVIKRKTAPKMFVKPKR